MSQDESRSYECEIRQRVQRLRDALAAGLVERPAVDSTPESAKQESGTPTGQWGQWVNWASWTKIM